MGVDAATTLLARDAACAAADRARNAATNRPLCPDSAAADADQIEALVAQSRGAATDASGTYLSADELTRFERLFTRVEQHLERGRLPYKLLATACHHADVVLRQ